MSWTTLLSEHQTQNTDSATITANQPTDLLYPLASYSVLEVSGPDRISFLQGQVTCDCERLANGESILGAHLDLKGRIEASFIAFPATESLLLIMPKEQVGYLLKALQKYALFSQVNLSENSTLLPCLSWGEAGIQANYSYQNPNIANLKLCLFDDQAGLNDAKLGKESDAIKILFRNGLLMVGPQEQGKYLPQELNYDILDGVSFKKGCYKGQEVVARIHFKGQVKQRLQSFSSTASMEPPSKVVNDAGKTAGELVCFQASSVTDLGFGCLLLKNAERESKSLCLEQNDAAELRLTPLPYAIT